MLDAHSYAGNTTEALHLLKDELLTLDGGMIHNIKADLILVVKAAYVKYIADLEQEKVIRYKRDHKITEKSKGTFS